VGRLLRHLLPQLHAQFVLQVLTPSSRTPGWIRPGGSSFCPPGEMGDAAVSSPRGQRLGQHRPEQAVPPPQGKTPTHPGGDPGANLKSISHRCYLEEVACVLELTKETIDSSLGCLQASPHPSFSSSASSAAPIRIQPRPMRRITSAEIEGQCVFVCVCECASM